MSKRRVARICNRMASAGNMVMPPAPLPEHDRVFVFLAGSIEMGCAEPWQAEIADDLEDTGALFLNPRRLDWDSSWEQTIDNDNFREQVEWELNGMEQADVIALYFDPETKAPISLLELGLHARGNKLIVCCPEGYWRKGNVDVVAFQYGFPVYEDKEDFKQAVRDAIGASGVGYSITANLLDDVKAVKIKAAAEDLFKETRKFSNKALTALENISGLVKKPAALDRFPEIKDFLKLISDMKKGVLRHTYMPSSKVLDRAEKVVEVDK